MEELSPEEKAELVKNARERFASRLCGITPTEVAALLSTMLRKEHHILTSQSASKRVRKFRANLLGIDLKVTEVNTSFRGRMPYEEDVRLHAALRRDLDYHIENMEWEFSVSLRDAQQILYYSKTGEPTDWGGSCYGEAKVGHHKMVVAYPNFEGDVDNYKRDMTMIRLMSLENDEPDEVMI